MSTTASWSYTNTATVKPFLSLDLMTGQTIYGDPFEIACTWVAKSEQRRSPVGAEFVSRFHVYTEDPRPKYLDMVQLAGDDDWQEIRDLEKFDMSFFGEEPDFTLIT